MQHFSEIYDFSKALTIIPLKPDASFLCDSVWSSLTITAVEKKDKKKKKVKIGCKEVQLTEFE